VASVDLGLPTVGRPARPEGMVGPASFHVLAKPAGAICNLDCSYCFFLSKEELYPGSSFRMGDDVLVEYVRQLLLSHRTPEVTVAWQGGEPTLMGLDFFRRAMGVIEQFRRPGQMIEHTIQTNCTLIDDEWASFLAEHDFLVGVSVDGPRQMHDAYRVDKGGKPTFDRVVRGLDWLKARGVRWNALTTVHRANEEHPLEVYRFLRDERGAEHIQFIPIVERPTEVGVPVGDVVTDRSVSPAGYGRFLVAVFEEWARRDVGRVFGRCSTRLWRASSVCLGRFVCTPKRAVPRLLSSIMAIFIRATISSIRNISWAISGHGICLSWSLRRSNGLSVTPSVIRCLRTAGPVTCGSLAMAVVRRIVSPPLLTASPASTICVRVTSSSSAMWTGPCG
jgi:anaerobic sulfatase-maturating enzyme